MTEIDRNGVLRALFEHHPEPIVLYDVDGLLIDANPAAQELSGYPLADLRGTHVSKLGSPKDAERLSVAARHSAKAGPFETTIRTKAGRIVPVQCVVFPALSHGEKKCTLVIARDLSALHSAELALDHNEERFRSLFEFHPDGILVVKADGRVLRVNLALENATGFFNEKLVGKPWTEIVAPESYEVAAAAFSKVMRGEACEIEGLFLDRLGERMSMQMNLVPLTVGSQVEGSFVIARNITAQRAAQQAIVKQSQRVRALYLITATDGTVQEQIDRTLSLGCSALGFEFGYLAKLDGAALTVLNVVGPAHTIAPGITFPRNLVISAHLDAENDSIYIPNLDALPWKGTVKRLGHPWKSYFALLLRVNGEPYGSLVFADRLPRTSGLAESDRDLAHLMVLALVAKVERREHEKRIEQLALHDALTGLPNRRLFDDRIRQTLATARRYDRGFAVMYLDLDNFKQVNDDLGHSAGDVLLRLVGERLRGTLRESDTVARFGGDEFVILQPIVDGGSDTSDMARKIVAAMQLPFDLEGTIRTVHTSIGIAIYPQDGTAIELLMLNADKALYRAKRTGRNRWAFSNEEEQRKMWRLGSSEKE